MEFVQIVEYQTSKPDEAQALGDAYRQKRMEEDPDTQITVMAVKDRDKENTYLTIVTFPSYEEAMANSEREDTQELAQKMGALCDGPPTFRNLDVLQRY